MEEVGPGPRGVLIALVLENTGENCGCRSRIM